MKPEPFIASPSSKGFVAVVLKGYPRLSETFIAREILGLEERGLELRLYALRRPRDPAINPVHDRINAPVRYLPEYLKDDIDTVARSWLMVRRWPGYRAARHAWLRDLKHDPSPGRIRRFGQAAVLASALGPNCYRIHAHFLHAPASVARYAAQMCRLPWSVSAHAKDVWTTPDWDKREKLESCSFAAVCTEEARQDLERLAPREIVHLLRHGLAEEPVGKLPARADRRGADPDNPVTILSVGRAVAKKGYDDLLQALVRLPDDIHWRFVHIGAGEELARLQKEAVRLGLGNRIEWLGAQSQDVVAEHYAAADLFVLASRVAPTGDRDGIPNVLMEAQAAGLACIATTAGGIPELILDGETGLLVSPGDPNALAEAMLRAIADPMLRRRLGLDGRARVRSQFRAEPTLDALAKLLGSPEPRSSIRPLAKAG
jgi:glycosyltransferase involved in cell wall biosynthesis